MARLDLSFLNTFAVDLDGQSITQFRSANNQGLLVYLALNSDKPQPRDVLATLFWPEETEKNGRHNLRQALYHLRTILGDTKSNGEPFLSVTRQTAQFNRQSDYSLDVHQFLEAIDRNDLETAVSLYEGDLLPGFTCDSLQFEDWLRQERESLHHLALEAMSELTEEHLGASRLNEAQEISRRQLSLERWRERAFRQLIRAYALAGDRSNAVAQFELCREILWEELGIEPAPETVTLYEEIEAGRFSALRTDESVRPPLKARHNLPANLTPLIGREKELARISHQFADNGVRLLTITGPGGMGKTRLALEAGASLLATFADGVYLVDLAPLAKPAEIVTAIAAALDYQAPDKSRELKPQLLDTLRAQSSLLILDNFEHLLHGTGIVNEILRSCPRLALLVTSRQRLNLAGESQLILSGLAFPETTMPKDATEYTAVQLFNAAARRTQPSFVLTAENVPHVLRICRQVLGMPLGLLLAAAWAEMLSPKEIAFEIDRSLDFLTAELADLPSRQRSMVAIFDTTWGLMSADEQKILARLSVFRGGFTRVAAEQVAGANLRILLSLVNKSLLQRHVESGRFTMHELLRQYAAQQRRNLDPEDEALLAHCRFFANLVRQEVSCTLHFFPLSLPMEHGADRDNFRRAWDYALEQGLAAEAADLGRGIAYLDVNQGSEAVAMLPEARDNLLKSGVQETDRALLYLGLTEVWLHSGIDSFEMHEARTMAFLSQIEKTGESEICLWTYLQWADRMGMEGRIELIGWLEKAVKVAQELNDEILAKFAEGKSMSWRVAFGLEEAETVSNLQALLAYFETDFGSSYADFVILWALCRLHRKKGQLAQMLSYGQRALNIAKHWQDLLYISQGYYVLTVNFLDMGLTHEAALQQLEALDWHLAIGQVWQSLGLIMGFCLGWPQFVGGPASAVTTLSMIYHHPENIPYNKERIAENRNRMEAELGNAAFVEAWERGKKLDFKTAVTQVRAALAAVE